MSVLAVLCPVDESVRTSVEALRSIADETAATLDGRVVSIELLRKQLPPVDDDALSTSLCLRVVVSTLNDVEQPPDAYSSDRRDAERTKRFEALRARVYG